jgi:hypothetical protein
METAFEEHPHIRIGHWCGEKVALPPFFSSSCASVWRNVGGRYLAGQVTFQISMVGILKCIFSVL